MLHTKFQTEIPIIIDSTALFICMGNCFYGKDRQVPYGISHPMERQPFHEVVSHGKHFSMEPLPMVITFPWIPHMESDISWNLVAWKIPFHGRTPMETDTTWNMMHLTWKLDLYPWKRDHGIPWCPWDFWTGLPFESTQKSVARIRFDVE